MALFWPVSVLGGGGVKYDPLGISRTIKAIHLKLFRLLDQDSMKLLSKRKLAT